MITFLRGKVAAVSDGLLVLDVNGVGFRVFISGRDMEKMPSAGKEVKIHTFLSVREDAMLLYGCLSPDDLTLFKAMISVSGVGPKAALGILSAMSANDIRFAVFSDDVKAISKAQGIGPKTAKKLILELKDKLKLEDALDGGSQAEDTEAAPAEAPSGVKAQKAVQDAVSALIALGYANSDALRAVRSVTVTEEMSTEEILKRALRQMS